MKRIIGEVVVFTVGVPFTLGMIALGLTAILIGMPIAMLMLWLDNNCSKNGLWASDFCERIFRLVEQNRFIE